MEKPFVVSGKLSGPLFKNSPHRLSLIGRTYEFKLELFFKCQSKQYSELPNDSPLLILHFL